MTETETGKEPVVTESTSNEEESVELAIESVQELAAQILGFAPLKLADDGN